MQVPVKQMRADKEVCPACGVDFRGKPDAHTGKRYSRKIGYVRGDKICSWRCPDCNHTWPRQ